MATIREAVKSAASVVLGTGIHGSGGTGGSLATDAALYDPVIARSIVDSMSATELYATQPHLRTVVSFVARNGAQLGRHVYAKDATGERTRVTSGSAADILARPNSYMTGYDLFNMLISELALHDMAIWVPVYRNGAWEIDPIPLEWVTGVKMATFYQAEKYRIQPTGKPEWYWISAADAVVFRGYNGKNFKGGSSAVRSLKGTLGEQVDAMEFRSQLWRRGGRVGMFMTRPKDAPTWSPEAKSKFVQSWKNSWSGNGANAGSTPLLEDGMELKRVGFTAKEEQWIEAATLSLTTVASAYHVPPAMVGVAGFNSFASVKEFRKMLYTETLGPLIAQIEDEINTFLFPLIGAPKNQYLELNIQEKLQGDFEEQAQQLFQATGGPYMTVNEARKRMNMGPIDGGDELLAPLNMGAVGNNGPEAGAPIEPKDPDPADPKARRDEVIRVPTHTEDGLSISLAHFFKAQRKSLSSSKKAAEWWDQKYWNQELSAILLPHLTVMSAGAARKGAGAKGLDPDAYRVGQTSAFLKAVADSRADLINATTRDRIEKTMTDHDVDLATASTDVFDEAERTRAPVAAKTMATFIGAWALTEMARQLLKDKSPKKTWVSSGLPNSRHSHMNGETVPIDQPFSNGAMWPADSILGAAEVANCACGVDITH